MSMEVDKNEAAISGTNTQQELHVMHNFGEALSAGYIRGIHCINPAIKSIFEEMAADIWKGGNCLNGHGSR